jgi:hypothetical protein
MLLVMKFMIEFTQHCTATADREILKEKKRYLFLKKTIYGQGSSPKFIIFFPLEGLVNKSCSPLLRKSLQTIRLLFIQLENSGRCYGFGFNEYGSECRSRLFVESGSGSVARVLMTKILKIFGWKKLKFLTRKPNFF